MPITRLQTDNQESEITPAPPIVTTNLQKYHRTNKVVARNPQIQAKIDIHQALYIVDKALSIEQKYREKKAEKTTYLSFFCCTACSVREADIDFISYLANNMRTQLIIAGMILEQHSSEYKKVQAIAKNAESIIKGSYVYLLRKIRSSNPFYNSLLRRKSAPTESVLYRIVSENLREKERDESDIDYLIHLSRYLSKRTIEDSHNLFLREEWLRKIQAQIDELSALSRDTSPDEEIASSDDEPLIFLKK